MSTVSPGVTIFVTLSVIIGILFLMEGTVINVTLEPAAVSGAPPIDPIIMPCEPVIEFTLKFKSISVAESIIISNL